MNVLRTLELRGRLNGAASRRAFEDYLELDLSRYPHTPLLQRIRQLATHVTAYDAAYIALAEALDATLVTTDLRLARTRGHRARIVAPE